MLEDSYPLYRRCNARRFIIKKVGRNKVRLNNRYIMPYNAYLLLTYNAYINYELCNSIKAIKYIYKYIYKGTNRATATLTSNKKLNKIAIYLHRQYAGLLEA